MEQREADEQGKEGGRVRLVRIVLEVTLEQRHEEDKGVWHRPGFLKLSATDIWGWMIFCCGVVPSTVGCLGASVASTHWLTVSSTTSSESDNQKCLRRLPNVLSGIKLLLLGATALDE